ncbi:filamin [Mytilus galloprovincialis]|uniref:Filamin n=2 Tax=Mytilus galloprovincialis TaxID=29158 RepID=A0A8B6E8F0_MYTGA|nr:filamin [Mytilus galloprovincialis]
MSSNTNDRETKWIEIQKNTFTNWVNEELRVSNRSVSDLGTDFCDGVNLVALVESLQLKKIGKVYAKPTTRIQMIQNVAIACKAITEDNIKLVNIGNEDIVNGNLKLILGLTWHLVMRYQISTRKTKSPPKQLMMNWFRVSIPGVRVNNFTTDWNDGIALHALIDNLKPGISPQWRQLNKQNKVQNCRDAMVLAKDHLNIPRVISPEDFANPALDELSAMTYLSYFVKPNSPGYYATLNWVCKQLKTTTISNLTTDWNDGYNLCAIVASQGGHIEGWPNLDRKDHVSNCQKAIDGGKDLGVEPLLTAEEIADPKVDHLSLMTYISRFQHLVPKKKDEEKIGIKADLNNIRTGVQALITLLYHEKDLKKEFLQVDIAGPSSEQINCDTAWKEKYAECKFVPKEAGEYNVNITYNNKKLVGCPLVFTVKQDLSTVRFITPTESRCRVGSQNSLQVDSADKIVGVLTIEIHNPNGDIKTMECQEEDGIYRTVFQPKNVGEWKIHGYIDGEEISNSPVVFVAHDPQKAWLTGPSKGVAGEHANFIVNCSEAGEGTVTADVRHVGKEVKCEVKSDEEENDSYQIIFKPNDSGTYFVYVKFNGQEIAGSPKSLDVVDPGQITVLGEGIVRGLKGKECKFQVNSGDIGGNISVLVERNGKEIDTRWREISSTALEFSYLPERAGIYKIKVMWNEREILGSPFHTKITDRSRVSLMDDLTELMDENGHLALVCNQETRLHYDITDAGPGSFNAEVLSPSGKLKVNLRKPDTDQIEVAFIAKEEGDHYIHLYWSDIPLDSSPIIAYCPGPILSVDHSKVILTGSGLREARAAVPAEFLINGKKAGPGVPKVIAKGVKMDPSVSIKPLKYDRYQCSYTAPFPGAYLIYVYWSEHLIGGTPYKISATMKGAGSKVKVSGQGLKGGYVGQELKVTVDTEEAGNGELTASCQGQVHTARCDVIDQRNGHYLIRFFPTEAAYHTLTIKYDHENVPGSPFKIPIGEPPDPRKVHVYGPGIEDGILHSYQSRFLVETSGAGAGQLAVRIKGPRGAFKVDMEREEHNDRTILCQYDPQEPGAYVITVKWSGHNVRGSPFSVHIFESKEELISFIKKEKGLNINPRAMETPWREEI